MQFNNQLIDKVDEEMFIKSLQWVEERKLRDYKALKDKDYKALIDKIKSKNCLSRAEILDIINANTVYEINYDIDEGLQERRFGKKNK